MEWQGHSWLPLTFYWWELNTGPHLAAREAGKCILQLKVIRQIKIILLRREGRTDFGDHCQSATGLIVKNTFNLVRTRWLRRAHVPCLWVWSSKLGWDSCLSFILGSNIIDVRNQSERQINVCRIAKEIATNQIRMWREDQCGQEITLAKAVTFKTSSLLREASMKWFGEIQCVHHNC